MADRHLPEFLGGAVAPDGLRFGTALGKRATHFYVEDEPGTWGRAVAGLFCSHPGLSEPSALPRADRAFMMGYVAHLATDEAFRDVVTSRVHGTADWRPVVQGLWSLADELPVHYASPVSTLDQFGRIGCVGFVDRAAVWRFICAIRPWVAETDPLTIELAFLEMTRRRVPPKDAQRELAEKRELASAVMDSECRARFVSMAVRLQREAIEGYLSGAYRADPPG